MIVAACTWVNDTGKGTRHRVEMPETDVRSIQETISRYWSDPYSFLGEWKRPRPEKSHPGRYYPDPEHAEVVATTQQGLQTKVNF